jgi:hypothetical protein
MPVVEELECNLVSALLVKGRSQAFGGPAKTGTLVERRPGI